MSDEIHFFETPGRATAVALPFRLDDYFHDWAQLRGCMVRQIPTSFSRDEWAYLIAFLDSANLLSIFTQTFGPRVGSPASPVRGMARPRGPVAVWLPNNVSLLGPLALVLLSLTGNPLRLKGGTQSEDLTGAFLAFAIAQLPEGPLRTYFQDQVRYAVFERNDARNKEMAASAQVRIVFGSDLAAEAIHALPHPIESTGFSFVNRRSEAWIGKGALNEGLLRDLIKVFAIYGQAGCTSPQRVVMLGATVEEAISVRDQIIRLWPKTIQGPPAMHVASGNIMARQWAAALGWDAQLTTQHAAVLAAGDFNLAEFVTTMGLMIVAGTVEEAAASLPPNIQTLGYALTAPTEMNWLKLLARTQVKRFVPIAQMHHFGPVWDGQDFWRQTFEHVQIQQ